MWYNEKFVYYSNSPGFYAIYFLGKKLFWCYTMYNWDVKIAGKEKKTIIVRNTNLVWCLLDCLFRLSKLLLLLLPGWLSPLSSPLFRRPRAARRASPGTLRIALRIARYFTHDQCGEWKYSDFRGEISYFTHELYAQNCIKCIYFKTKWKNRLIKVLSIADYDFFPSQAIFKFILKKCLVFWGDPFFENGPN